MVNNYAVFTVKHYDKAIVVFNDYSGSPSTKDNTNQNTHQQLKQNCSSHEVNINETTKCIGKVEDFLSINENKQTLIYMTTDCIKKKTVDGMWDAMEDDIDTAEDDSINVIWKTAMLLGKDTDLLQLHCASSSIGTKPQGVLMLCVL